MTTERGHLVWDFQQRMGQWVKLCFGSAVAANRQERKLRFAEESCELLQATGFTKEEMLQIVDSVWDEKEPGELGQETGGTIMTLCALLNAYGVDLVFEAEKELNRCYRDIDIIRQKQAAKKLRG